jgi:hypothetical protein
MAAPHHGLCALRALVETRNEKVADDLPGRPDLIFKTAGLHIDSLAG